MPESPHFVPPETNAPRIAARAVVSSSARIGQGSRVWDDSFVEDAATIGRDCVIGRGVTIGAGVTIGDRSKIQNGALIYEPASIGSGVFIGPAAVLTNDREPRAVAPDGRAKMAGDWRRAGVTVETGASVGARAVCVAPVTVGRWAMVGAGAVVTRDVNPFALVVGVPARQVGWVSRSGARLVAGPEDTFTCPDTGARFRHIDGLLEEDHS